MPEWLKRYAQPREGWLSLALLVVMLLSVSWSVQRTNWIEQTEFLVPVALYAVVLGTLLGLSRLSIVAVVPISALAGTAILLWAIGGEYFPDASQVERLVMLRRETIDWVLILIDRGYGPQLVPYALAFGLVMWVTAFMAGFAVYRHHRVLDAILLVGAALITNMSAAVTDLFDLVLFMLAALLLWLRAALIGKEEGWQRRRVNENAEVPAAIMRSGVVFIAGSIALAWVLTSVAVAAPLTAVWNNLDGVWRETRDRLDAVFGGLSNPDARISGATFGNAFRIDGSFVSSDDEVLTIAAPRNFYLRTTTYDRYTGHGFARSSAEERRVPAGELVFPEYSPEQPLLLEAFDRETVSIVHSKSMGGAIFTPGFPVQITVPSVVLETGGLPILGGLESASSVPSGTGYVVTTLVSKATKAQLGAATQVYPPEIAETYLGTEGVSTRTRELALDIIDRAGAQNPYEMAEALADFLRTDSTFRYNTSAPTPRDPNADIVDFFLFDTENGRIGYCEYYATAMAVMARTLGLPSRVAVGFAPGEPIPTTGGVDAESNAYVVRERNAHAWTEIYFPGYGWERFEATKTIAPVTRIQGTAPRPGSSGGALPSLPPRLDPDDRGNISELPSFQPAPEGFGPRDEGPAADPRGGNVLLIVGIVVLGLAVAAWRLRNARRRMRFLAPGERQWFRLALAADRAGVAQRPNETIYEYASWLEEQIPRHRPEIRTIAQGKVWQSYSGRSISGQALARIEAAWKRIEMPMLWLAVRRRLAALIPSRRRPAG